MADPAGFVWPTAGDYGSSLAAVVQGAAGTDLVPPVAAQAEAVGELIESTTGLSLSDVVRNFGVLVTAGEARVIAETAASMSVGVATQALTRALAAAGAAEAAANNAGALAQVLGLIIGRIIGAAFERERKAAAQAQCDKRAMDQLAPVCRAQLQRDRPVPTHPSGATPADMFRELAFWLAGKRQKPPLALSSIYLWMCGDAVPVGVQQKGINANLAIPRARRVLMWQCIDQITSSVVPADPPRPRLGDSGATAMVVLQDVLRDAWRSSELRIVFRQGDLVLPGTPTDALFWANKWLGSHYRNWVPCPDIAGESASVPDSEATCDMHVDFGPPFIDSLREFENRLLEDFQNPPRSGNWEVPGKSRVAALRNAAAALARRRGRARSTPAQQAIVGAGAAALLGYLATLL